MMRFYVIAQGQKRPVEFEFASESDLLTLRRWRAPAPLRENPHVQDSLEYSRLASKRWRSYRKADRTVTSLPRLEQIVRENSHAEIVFLMVARADWHESSPILSFCFCRRTYCHHLVIDFAANHPNAIGPAGGEVRGVGPAMFYSLVKFAHEFGIKTIWGEATENSAKFYRKIFAFRKVTDHFFVRGRAMSHGLKQYDLLMDKMQH